MLHSLLKAVLIYLFTICLKSTLSNQISLLSHNIYNFKGTRLCAKTVQATIYEKCTIYINKNIHTLHNIHICTIDDWSYQLSMDTRAAVIRRRHRLRRL